MSDSIRSEGISHVPGLLTQRQARQQRNGCQPLPPAHHAAATGEPETAAPEVGRRQPLGEAARFHRSAAHHPEKRLGRALENVRNSQLDELVVTDTIPLSAEAKSISKIRQLTIADLLAESIRRVSNEESISALFDA